MKSMVQTSWQAMDLIVKRDGREIDRLAAGDIERVIIVYRDGGATPGDLAYAVVQTREHDLLFPPETGIAGRVHFERQSFWRAAPLRVLGAAGQGRVAEPVVPGPVDPAPAQAWVRAPAQRRVDCRHRALAARRAADLGRAQVGAHRAAATLRRAARRADADDAA